MRALTVREPYASEIMAGRKTIEYRTWRTSHRGDLLICAARRPAGANAGHATCIVTVTHVEPLPDGTYAWHLRDPRPVPKIPIRGRLGLFDVALSAPAE